MIVRAVKRLFCKHIRKCAQPSSCHLDEEEHRECSICMTNIVPNEKQTTVTTPCNHVFHQACLDKWTERSTSCPLCRATICERHSEHHRSVHSDPNWRRQILLERLELIMERVGLINRMVNLMNTHQELIEIEEYRRRADERIHLLDAERETLLDAYHRLSRQLDIFIYGAEEE